MRHYPDLGNSGFSGLPGAVDCVLGEDFWLLKDAGSDTGSCYAGDGDEVLASARVHGGRTAAEISRSGSQIAKFAGLLNPLLPEKRPQNLRRGLRLNSLLHFHLVVQ